MLMEDDDVLNYVFTLLSHTKTFINSCQLIEDMLQSKRQVLDLHRISKYNLIGWLVGFMVFNATFNNISVISWQSDLLMEGTGENH
jgi:hypothetical protein